MSNNEQYQEFVRGFGRLVGKEIIGAAITNRDGEHVLIFNYVHEGNVLGFDLPLDIKALEKSFEEKGTE